MQSFAFARRLGQGGAGLPERNPLDPLTLSLFVALALALLAIAWLVLRRIQSAGDDRFERLAETAERLAAGQAALAGELRMAQSVTNERLDGLAKRLGESLTHQTEKTGETLKVLHERLAVIDAAQHRIVDLSKQVVSLNDVLANKQARGAFGQIQMEDLVRELLPASAYEFQATLSNRTRVDCLVRLPSPPGAVAIDAKFPLESYRALAAARDEAARTQAARAFTVDLKKHVDDIAGKYILPGETAEWALMFLPSEAVYAEVHAAFGNVVEEAHRKRVGIVSPSTLMATLATVRAVMRDAQMHLLANRVRAEVAVMIDDVRRLAERVEKLRTHLRQADEDLQQIGISTEKIVRKGTAIAEMELPES